MEHKSLFQTSNDKIIGSNSNEIDEEEENADQIRRNLELAQNLDKYLDIEDESVDQLETSLEFLNRSNESELSRLRDVLLTKNHELETLKDLLTKETQEKISILNDFQKKIRILEAERDRSIMSKNQMHDLLVESKTEVSILESNVHELMEKIKSTEINNSNLTAELQHTKTLLSDLQLEYNSIQQEMKEKHNTSYVDSTIKRLQEKNSVQLDIMQQQIDSLSSKLNHKECETKILNIRNKDLEVLMIEKSEEIKNLKIYLEEKQDLIVSYNSLHEETKLLQKTNQDLMKQNENLRNEILMLEKRLTENQISNGENNEKRLQKEIRNLEAELEKKKYENLQQFKDFENKYMIEANEFKESRKRLECRIRNLEDELHFHENDYCQKCHLYLNQLQDLQSKHLEMNNAIENYKKETDCLRKNLRESNDSVTQLNNKIAIQESQNALISELQLKANQFEMFMSGEKCEKTLETDLKVIQDMTQKYAMEVKTIEKKCKDEIQNYKNEIEKLKMCLHVKSDEIKSLKIIIMKERVKINEIIMCKEKQAKTILVHQNEVIRKCKLELQLHQKEMENLKNIQFVKNSHIIENNISPKITIMRQDTLNHILRIKEKNQLAKLTAQQHKYGLLEKKEQRMVDKKRKLNEFHKNVALKFEKQNTIDSEHIYLQLEKLKQQE